MLVLSRRQNQVIELTGGIRVMVCEIRGDKVRIGIEAPEGVRIWREELQPPPPTPAPGSEAA